MLRLRTCPPSLQAGPEEEHSNLPVPAALSIGKASHARAREAAGGVAPGRRNRTRPCLAAILGPCFANPFVKGTNHAIHACMHAPSRDVQAGHEHGWTQPGPGRVPQRVSASSAFCAFTSERGTCNGTGRLQHNECDAATGLYPLDASLVSGTPPSPLSLLPRCSLPPVLGPRKHRPATVRVPAGPGVKIVGGELRSMYDERPASKVTLGHTADFSEIKRQYMQSANAPHAPAPGGGGVQGTGEPLPRASTTLGSGAGSTTSRTRKIIYFDGKSHHVVDATDGPGQRWVPPHLKGDDVAPGVQLGVRETPGSVRVKLIGSKFRWGTSRRAGGGGGGSAVASGQVQLRVPNTHHKPAWPRH